MSGAVRVWAWIALVAGVCAGQPSFDVASVKPSPLRMGEGSGRMRLTVRPTGVTFENATLSDCIQWAYKVRFYQIAGPDWISSERYDIAAGMEHALNVEQLRDFLRGMLAQRFRLDFHHESRVRPVYALTVRKNAVSLPPSTQPASMRAVNGSFVFTHVTMGDLAEHLSELAALDRPVVDRTGVAGIFDVTLRQATAATRDDPGPIFTALGELGLELKAEKAPLDTMAIDHAERPGTN
jgi:uncharacterized protein (TIGR03435 family)